MNDTDYKQTETQLVRACIDYLLYNGHFVWRNNTGMQKLMYSSKKTGMQKLRMFRSGLPGSSDIIGIAQNGRFIAVECKIGKNKPTQLQTDFLDKVSERGGYALVVYDIKDLEQAKL